MPQESAALVMLAASLLVFRAFRERYLLIWTLGWLAYFVSRWTLHHHGVAGSSFGMLIAISQARIRPGGMFVRGRDLRLHPCPEGTGAVAVFSIAVIVYAAVRALWWPDSITLRVALEVAYRLIALPQLCS